MPTIPYHPDPYYGGYHGLGCQCFQCYRPAQLVSPFSYTPLPKFTVPNKRVALEPFPTGGGTEVVGGVLRPKNQAALVGLKVVYGNEQFPEGVICYVRADKNRTTLWGKELLEVDGKKFLLVPEEEIVLVDRYGGYDLGEAKFTFTTTQTGPEEPKP